MYKEGENEIQKRIKRKKETNDLKQDEVWCLNVSHLISLNEQDVQHRALRKDYSN